MKKFGFLLLLVVSMMMTACSAVKVSNPTDLAFIANGTAKTEPMFIQRQAVNEKGIAKVLTLKLRDKLPKDGFNLVEKSGKANVNVYITVEYLGFSEEAAKRSVGYKDVVGTSVVAGTQTFLSTEAGVQTAAALIGNSSLLVPGVGFIVKGLIDTGVWAYHHGEDDYYMGTNFIVIEEPKVKGEPQKQFAVRAFGKGHYKGRGEAIDDLTNQAAESFTKFLDTPNATIGITTDAAAVSATN